MESCWVRLTWLDSNNETTSEPRKFSTFVVTRIIVSLLIIDYSWGSIRICNILVVYHLHGQTGRSTVWANAGTQTQFRTGKFRPESRLPFMQISSIYRKTTAKAWNWYQRWLWRNGTRISVWNQYSIRTNRTTFSDVPFPLGRPRKSCSIYFPTRFPRKCLLMVNNPWRNRRLFFRWSKTRGLWVRNCVWCINKLACIISQVS